MLRDKLIEVTVERGIGDSATRPMVVVGSGGELVCSVHKRQYDALMGVVVQARFLRSPRNLLAPSMRSPRPPSPLPLLQNFMSRGDRDTADRRAGLLPPMLSTEAQSDLGVALATPRGASDGGIRLGIQPQATHRRRLPSCSAHAALRPVLLQRRSRCPRT